MKSMVIIRRVLLLILPIALITKGAFAVKLPIDAPWWVEGAVDAGPNPRFIDTYTWDGSAWQFQGSFAEIQIGHFVDGFGWPQIFSIKGNGYLRGVPPGYAWGTSFLGTGYWKDGQRIHTLEITELRIRIDSVNSKLLLLTGRAYDNPDSPTISANDYTLRIFEPTSQLVRARVEYTLKAESAFTIDADRQTENHEGFRVAQLQSNYIDSKTHDADRASYVDAAQRLQVAPLRNENTFIFSNPLPLGKQGFYLQYTDADQRKPSCAVHIIHPGYAEFVPQGWIEHTTDPNADNVGAWINWENAKLSYEAGEEIGRFVYYLDVGGNNISPSNQDAGTVELGSSGPPNWSYRLTWNSGAVSEWTYIGSGITGASVSGSAADAGWATLKITATEVTFIGGSPLTTAGTLDGFVIEGTQQGMGRWKCHANEGSVDGPLPVNLSEFSATWQQDAILIRWRTAVEIGNAGWNIYRGSHREGPFQRINPKMIRADGRTIAREYEWKDSEVRKGQSYFYYLESVDFSGNSERSKVISAEEAVSEKRPQPVLMLKPVPPSRTEALAPYPNPLNPEVWLPYRLAEPAEVTILIYDVNGRLVRSWKLGRQPAGDYIDKKRALYWDGRNQFGERLPNGVYIYQFKAGSYTATKKLVILK